MYSRIQIVEAALSTVAHVGPPYLDSVNSFPSVAVLRPSIAGKRGEQHQRGDSRRATVVRNSIGGRHTLDSFKFVVRGYVSTTLETSIDDCDALARQIELAIQAIDSPLIYDAWVETVQTDEGLYAPYGICDLQCVVEWVNEPSYSNS